MIKTIFNWIRTGRYKKKFKSCFFVSWDDTYVCIETRLPNRSVTLEKFRWQDIEKICMEAKCKKFSDEIFFFTSDRLEAYIVPVEANGGHELIEVLILKKL